MNNLTLPSRLYKYYSCNGENKQRIEARLKGEIYFSSPLKFNDPCDCQLPKIINNTATFSKGKDRIIDLLSEEGFLPEETYKKLIDGDKSTIQEVHRRQADLLGILCFTYSNNNSMMWGQYAQNNGLCIEYNMSRLVSHLKKLFRSGRLCMGNVTYENKLPTTANLFFEDTLNECQLKYWHKFKEWENEKEFRIGISLGGNMSIKIPNIVEHIYLGCNAPDELIRKVQRICQKNKLNIPISIMTKKAKGLSPIGLQEWLSKRNK